MPKRASSKQIVFIVIKAIAIGNAKACIVETDSVHCYHSHGDDRRPAVANLSRSSESWQKRHRRSNLDNARRAQVASINQCSVKFALNRDQRPSSGNRHARASLSLEDQAA
jgi:hypothetical protein